MERLLLFISPITGSQRLIVRWCGKVKTLTSKTFHAYTSIQNKASLALLDADISMLLLIS